MIVLPFLLFSICAIYFVFGRRGKNKEPPLYSGAWPIVQHAPLLFNADGKTLWKLWQDTAAECCDKGGVIRFGQIIPQLTHYVIGNPDDVLTVATACLTKAYIYKTFKPQLGNSLFTANGEDWKHKRKQIFPAFSQNYMKSLMGSFNNVGRSIADEWALKVGQPFEHFQSISEAVLVSIVGDAGKDCNMSYKDYVNSVEILDRAVTLRIGHVPWHLDFVFNLSKEGRMCKKAVKIVRAEAQKLVNATKERLRKGNRPISVVDYIIEHCDFKDTELVNEVNTMLIAGHTTSASTLSTFLMLLGSYPHVQERLYQEIISVYGYSDQDVEIDDFAKLPYLDAALKETLRLYPPAPILLRYCEKEIELKNYTLPAGRQHVIHIYAVNTHPVWGEDRMAFKPERWLEPDKLPPQHAFATFSLGKRSCIGKNYSMLSLRTLIIHLMRRYKVFGDISKCVITLEFLIKPASGGIIQLQKRNEN